MFPAGVWGLESRARCAGFSVTEIGNRKKRFAFLYEFPGSVAPIVFSRMNREENKRFIRRIHKEDV